MAWLPGMLWRLDTNWRALRVEVPWLERKPSEVAREHISFSTQPLEHTDGNDPLFFEMLADAAADSGRRLSLRAITGQPHDHPEIITIPETGYIKGALLQAVN